MCSVAMKVKTSYIRLRALILVCFYYQGINSTICTDRADLDGFTNVLTMCSGETLTAGRVVVDTYDTGVLGHVSCQCTVRLINAGPVRFDVSAYPDTVPAPDCRSLLQFIRYPVITFTENRCQRITGDIIYNFTIDEIFNIMLSRSNDNIQWQSGYCIFIQSNVNINVTCGVPSGPGTSPPTSATTTKTTTTPPTNPTTTSLTTDSIQTVTNQTSSDVNGNVNDGEVKEPSIGVEIIAGAAGGGAVLLVVLIIVIVVIIRKKRSDVKNAEDNFSVDIQPYAVATPKFYQNEGADTLTQNSLYVSAGPRDPDINHIVTETGDMYAQVQKPTQYENFETELSNSSTGQAVTTPSGDMYAVINKQRKQSDDRKDESQTDEDRRPSRYKNQDGLVYAEIEDTTSRPKSRPPVRPKPKHDADRVIYSEVNTGEGV